MKGRDVIKENEVLNLAGCPDELPLLSHETGGIEQKGRGAAKVSVSSIQLIIQIFFLSLSFVYIQETHAGSANFPEISHSEVDRPCHQNSNL